MALFEEMKAQTGDEGSLKWALIHHEIIARFGRFPHRNRALGRVTTPQEQAFLDEGGFAGLASDAEFLDMENQPLIVGTIVAVTFVGFAWGFTPASLGVGANPGRNGLVGVVEDNGQVRAQPSSGLSSFSC